MRGDYRAEHAARAIVCRHCGKRAHPAPGAGVCYDGPYSVRNEDAPSYTTLAQRRDEGVERWLLE